MRTVSEILVSSAILTFGLGASAFTAQRGGPSSVMASSSNVHWKRDQVLASLSKGDFFQAWRFAINALRSRTRADRFDGLGVLLNLVRKEKSFNVPGRALIEDMLVRTRELDSTEQGMWLLAYGNMEEAYVDPISENRSTLYATHALQAHALSHEASSFCLGLLASTDGTKQRASIPILLVSAKLGGRDKVWSVKLCREQFQRANHGNSNTWQILFETVTGAYVP
ncbi:MAG: hypothetical protein P4L87_21585 [Formivibrio sp.]|nr:hypothetical protein [Formivibrio sp.]